jgi:hypothetical protein
MRIAADGAVGRRARPFLRRFIECFIAVVTETG